MRTALIVAGFALALAGVAGCGDDGPPTDASAEDFCANFEAFSEDLAGLGEDGDASAMVEALKNAAGNMQDTGTPEDISDDAREGFELSMQAIDDLDDGASQEDLDQIDADFSDSEQEKVDAFDEYLAETCELS